MAGLAGAVFSAHVFVPDSAVRRSNACLQVQRSLGSSCSKAASTSLQTATTFSIWDCAHAVERVNACRIFRSSVRGAFGHPLMCISQDLELIASSEGEPTMAKTRASWSLLKLQCVTSLHAHLLSGLPRNAGLETRSAVSDSFLICAHCRFKQTRARAH